MKIRIRKHIRNIFWGSYEDVINPLLKRKGNKWIHSERIFENAYAIGNAVKIRPKNILEIGCSRSTVPIELATLGFKVTGIDLRDYPLFHPNFKFLKGDFTQIQFDHQFDMITCISVFEHVGLGAYGEIKSESIVLAFANKIIECLNHNGNLIITVPLYSYKKDFQRNIKYEDILRYFRKLELVESVFFKEMNGIFVKPSEQNQEPMAACFIFRKL